MLPQMKRRSHRPSSFVCRRLYTGLEIKAMFVMRFCKDLYMSPSVKNKRRRVIWKLRTGRPQPIIYVIALAKNDDLLEIYHSSMLKQDYYREKENSPYIVGLAAGYGQAVKLVADMLEDVYRITGGYDVKTFFRS